MVYTGPRAGGRHLLLCGSWKLRQSQSLGIAYTVRHDKEKAGDLQVVSHAPPSASTESSQNASAAESRQVTKLIISTELPLSDVNCLDWEAIQGVACNFSQLERVNIMVRPTIQEVEIREAITNRCQQLSGIGKLTASPWRL